MTTWQNQPENQTSGSSYELLIDNTFMFLIDDNYEFLIQDDSSNVNWQNQNKN